MPYIVFTFLRAMRADISVVSYRRAFRVTKHRRMSSSVWLSRITPRKACSKCEYSFKAWLILKETFWESEPCYSAILQRFVEASLQSRRRSLLRQSVHLRIQVFPPGRQELCQPPWWLQYRQRHNFWWGSSPNYCRRIKYRSRCHGYVCRDWTRIRREWS